jgi:hypothetical protein
LELIAHDQASWAAQRPQEDTDMSDAGTQRLASYHAGTPRRVFASIDLLPRSRLVVSEEELAHPEEPLFVSLAQVSDSGDVVGELLLSVPELLALVADLREQLALNHVPGTRQWRGTGDGPQLNFEAPLD